MLFLKKAIEINEIVNYFNFAMGLSMTHKKIHKLLKKDNILHFLTTIANAINMQTFDSQFDTHIEVCAIFSFQ